MSAERFTKTLLASWCHRTMLAIEHEYRIDSGNGWAQCTGRSEEFCRNYGKYDCLRSIMDCFNLWDSLPKERE